MTSHPKDWSMNQASDQCHIYSYQIIPTIETSNRPKDWSVDQASDQCHIYGYHHTRIGNLL